MSKRKPPKPDMNTCPNEHSQTDSLYHTTKESDIKSPTHKAVNIEGTLLMLDDVTPHVAVPVQAICNGKVIATALSDESGKYQFINLRPEGYQVRCQILDRYVYYGEEGKRAKRQGG